jgi:hypothetical protein
MIRAFAFGIVALAALSGAALAQETPAARPPASRGWSREVIHYGKWATAATAVGLTILAAREHARAQDEWRELLSLCRDNNAACQLRQDGRYVNYDAELLFQLTTYYDRRARSRLIGGQVSLLASATLFILDLRHQGGNPPNIPFHGLELSAEPTSGGARLELRVPF